MGYKNCLQATFNLLASRMPVQSNLISCSQPRKHRLTNAPYSLKPTAMNSSNQGSRRSADMHANSEALPATTPAGSFKPSSKHGG